MSPLCQWNVNYLFPARFTPNPGPKSGLAVTRLTGLNEPRQQVAGRYHRFVGSPCYLLLETYTGDTPGVSRWNGFRNSEAFRLSLTDFDTHTDVLKITETEGF
jgi:hypothetical protein